jgi:flagellar hook-associated protein 3 FlgL
MRISTSTFFDSNVAGMGQQQSLILKTQQQISTGRRILTAADDPAAAAQALVVTQSDATNTQYTTNRNAAQNVLSFSESTLQSVTNLLQAVKSEAVSAGDGSLSNSDRRSIAKQLSGQLQDLVGLANSTDGAGNYLFSGFQSRTQPFVNTVAGMSYFGDDGQRNVQVSASRQVASSDSGADVFMRIKNGNGTFVTQPGTNTVTPGPNLGTGVISVGSVANPPPTLPLDNYSVAFTVTP